MESDAENVVVSGVEGMRCAVTGAASGIGDAVARVLARSGASVTSLDIKEPTARVDHHIPCDLSDPDSIGAAVEALGTAHDALVNVAGVPGTLPDDTVIKVNFLGLRLLSESLTPRLRDGGAIVNVASTAGWQWPERLPLLLEFVATASFDEGLAWFQANAPADVPAYFFSKEAVIVYTMRACQSAWARGIRVNSVSPGPVQTPILGDFEDSMGKDTLDGVKAIVGRHATPEDIAPLAVFLASPASRWVNGANLFADGGALGGVLSGVVAMPT
jgi:NAD(P)-dependent dehydrogenase (short-subunit alcohol dehydrogenase family)